MTDQETTLMWQRIIAIENKLKEPKEEMNIDPKWLDMIVHNKTNIERLDLIMSNWQKEIKDLQNEFIKSVTKPTPHDEPIKKPFWKLW